MLEDMYQYDARLWVDLAGVILIVAMLFALGVLLWKYLGKTRILDFSEIPLPQLTPFDGQGVHCSCEKTSCLLHERMPESAIIGSNYTKVPTTRIPKVQAALYRISEEGKPTLYLGCALRIDDWLVVPYHAVVSEENLAVITLGRDGKTPSAFKVKAESFHVIDGDVAAMKLSEKDFSQLGLSKPGIAPLETDMMVSICSSSPLPEMSFGLLLNDQKVFGGVVFHGSTRSGFSGAAYMIGNQIAGMHLGGGVMNYGVSASYILALLKKEESPRILELIRRKQGRVRYQRSKFSPDEAHVFYRGRYITVDLADLEEEDTEEIQEGPTVKAARVPEVNLTETFPPVYKDIVLPAVEGITNITEVMRSKNLEVAEQCSAEQADEYMKMYHEMNAKLDEHMMLIQGLQNSVADRYREMQSMITKIPKDDPARKTLVEENEKLKKELQEIKKLKTDANVDASSVKPIQKSVKKAVAKKEGAKLLDKLKAEGITIEALVEALTGTGLVQRVEQPVGNAETTTVLAEEQENKSQTPGSKNTSKK